jgi:microsomal dipeptidase-like Zn-dependent dipeptidase
MNRRRFLLYSLTVGTMVALGEIPAYASWLKKCKEGRLPPGMVVIDAHAHPDQFYYLEDPTPDLSSTLEKIKTLGMQASNFAAIGDTTSGSLTLDEVFEQVQYVNNLENSRLVHSIRTHAGMHRFFSRKRSTPGAILSLEGANPLGDTWEDVSMSLDNLYALGIRMITIMHKLDNQFGESMHKPGKEGSGLSELGQQLMERMIGMGIVVDGAHAHYATLSDMADIARSEGVPLIDSHTSLNPITEYNGSRLRTWEEMEMIAGTGGIICTWPLQEPSVGRLTILDWALENYEIMKKLGAKHIALGTDGGGKLPAMVDGYESILDLPKLIEAMHKVGFKRKEIEEHLQIEWVKIRGFCS